MEMFVGNLPYSMEDSKLSELFSQFGNVERVKIIKDRDSGRSKGFGFVTMSDQDAAKAIEGLNNTEVDGRTIKVNEARPKEDRPHHRRGGGHGHRRDR